MNKYKGMENFIFIEKKFPFSYMPFYQINNLIVI